MNKREKQLYNVYRVETFGNCEGAKERRTYIGATWAVSEEKARANVEYRERGRAMYRGVAEFDLGAENWADIHYEAELTQ